MGTVCSERGAQKVLREYPKGPKGVGQAPQTLCAVWCPYLVVPVRGPVKDKMKAGNAKAKEVVESWAKAEWFTKAPQVPEKLTVTVFKAPPPEDRAAPPPLRGIANPSSQVFTVRRTRHLP